MKPSLSIMTLFRSPTRTLLTFVLLGAVTFALFSQIAEYAITSREYGKATSRYVGIGTAELEPPKNSNTGFPIPYDEYGIDDSVDIMGLIEPYKYTYQYMTREQISAIAALPYITTTDTRYMTAGVSDEYFRLDDGNYSYSFTSRCVVEATLADFYTDERFRASILSLSDCRVLAGVLPWGTNTQTIEVRAVTFISHEGVGGSSEGPVRRTFIWTPRYKYLPEYIQETMTLGNRYVFTLRYDILEKEGYFYLHDYLAEPWCAAIIPINNPDVPKGDTCDYLEYDSLAPLRKLIEITNADMHTFDIVYTDDMDSIMRFALGKMAIIDGRALTAQDSKGGAPACVVSRELASSYNLAVGDTITLRLGTKLFEQYKSLGAVAVYPERYEPPSGDAVALQIVGIYTNTDGLLGQSLEPNWSYSINTIFVPKTLLHVQEELLSFHRFTPAEFSFKIAEARNIPAFLEEAEPILDNMGLKLVFDDGGWSEIAEGYRSAKQTSIVKIAILSAAVAVVTWTTVYLFIGRKKKEYAIMRALGTNKKASARAMLTPLMSVVATSVFVGVGVAWIYIEKTVAYGDAFSTLEGLAFDGSVPAWIIAGCVLGELALAFAIALTLLRSIDAQPPLALLQVGALRTKKVNTKIRSIDVGPSPKRKPPIADFADDTVCDDYALHMHTAVMKVNPLRFVITYVVTHMRRAVWKSALVILAMLLLLVTVGQLAMMGQSYTELFENTVIVANVTGGMRHALVPKFKESGYVADTYYARRETMDIATSTTQLVVTNNIPRFIGEDVDITYFEGYDATAMDGFGEVIIIGKALADWNGIKPGDMIDILPPGYVKSLNHSTVARYRKSHPDDPITDEDILGLLYRQIIVDISRASRKFLVIGIVSTPSGEHDRNAFTPGIAGSSVVYGTDAKLDIVQFELSDNYQAREFRKFGEETIGANISIGILFLMDTGKLENLENTLNLLEALYPMAVAASMLIGGFLCCLIVLQSSKDAAIMRVLGTTKRKTRAILAIELTSLNIAGLGLGLCLLFMLNGQGLCAIFDRLFFFVPLFFATMLACTAVSTALATRRSPLELLQTKE